MYHAESSLMFDSEVTDVVGLSRHDDITEMASNGASELLDAVVAEMAAERPDMVSDDPEVTAGFALLLAVAREIEERSDASIGDVVAEFTRIMTNARPA